VDVAKMKGFQDWLSEELECRVFWHRSNTDRQDKP
jgi:hypothetical protein